MSILFENSEFKIEKNASLYSDTFSLEMIDGLIKVQRTDSKKGWGQNLMLKLTLKSSNKTHSIFVGRSEKNTKIVELTKWTKYKEVKEAPRMLVVLAGAAFRYGRDNVNRDKKESFAWQKRACLSHVDFFEHVKKKWGLECEVLISSYQTAYEDNIREWYGSRLAATCYRKNLIGLQNLALMALAEAELSRYECAFVSRIDLEYKPYLKSIFDPNWEKIMFPSMCWIRYAYLSRSIPRISDTMEFVPKKLFKLVKENFSLNHDSWRDYLNKKVSSKEMGLFIDTYHDSDSAKDYNPLYRIVNRQVSNNWHSANLLVDKDMKPKKSFTYLGFPDWSPPVTKNYEDENFLIAIKYQTKIVPHCFEISLDKEKNKVNIGRKDLDFGWEFPLVLFVMDKINKKEFELYVGTSKNNKKSIPLDQKLNVMENEKLCIEVAKNKFSDLFDLHLEEDGTLIVTRIDEPTGWGQNLLLLVKDKTTKKKETIRIGPSNTNQKSVKVDYLRNLSISVKKLLL